MGIFGQKIILSSPILPFCVGGYRLLTKFSLAKLCLILRKNDLFTIKTNNMEFSQPNQDPHPTILDNDVDMERHKRLMRSGQIWLCTGLGMLGLSFALNMLFHAEGSSILMVMYGLTTIGVSCVMKSLVNIFN